jgi:tetratricopeptide (TPR) repeat protein
MCDSTKNIFYYIAYVINAVILMLYLFLLFFFFASFLFAQSYEQKKCAADTAQANELFTLGEKFEKTSKLDSAAVCYEQAAEIWEKACPEVKGEKRKRFWEGYLKSKNSRGLVFYREGKPDSAAAYYLQSALQKALPWLGENHLDVADNYNNTGVIYFAQGRYAEALQYFPKALAIWLAIFGEEHAKVALSYNNMGITYRLQERYNEALQYYQKTLAIRLAALGQNHPLVASSYNNIGTVYASQERYMEALQYYQKALAINLTVLDTNHSDLASNYNNIANIYALQERYAEALQYYQKILTIWLIIDKNHPNAAPTYNNIGIAYQEQGRYAEALQFFEKALAIKLAVFGENHPDLWLTYSNIGAVHEKQGNYAEALQFFEKALAIQLAAFGEKHPDIAHIYNNIGNVYKEQGRYAQALEHCQKALESNAPYWNRQENFQLPPPGASIFSPGNLLTTLTLQSQTLFKAVFSPQHSATYRPHLPYALKAARYGASQLSRWRQTMRREADQIELGKRATEFLSTGAACAFLMDSLGIKEQAPLKDAFFFSESNKAATLNLAIQANEALVAAGIPESLNTLQQDYKRELTLCNQRLETVLKPETKDDTLKKQYYENRRFIYSAQARFFN